MSFNVQIDGRETTLDVRENGAGREFRLGSGEWRRAQVLEVEPGVFSILLDGRSYEARVENAQDGAGVTIGGRRMRVELQDPRRANRQSAGRRTDGPLQVAAPMPGKIVRFLVARGDEVVAGQGLVVIEAMKMQNELKAARPGLVAAIPVREGETVSAGAVLVVIE
ncbi:MAG: biotin/lipoyl-binding protein [Candidatus Solibacter usitatus]|nr:biotin/lipoyl-binding protein [Candidatus Solibacter usitatus]